jgi:glycosyltransferase involved in cell wall biosynthesis
MWTKNGEKFLPKVLKRIDEVFPSKFVSRRIMVDDNSEDNSVKVAKDFGWTVYKNRGRGLKEAIVTALSYVSADFFVSVEHDVILAKDWWEKIPKYMEDEQVAVAQGVRIATHPILRKLDEYIVERKDICEDDLISIDNNIYRTSIICVLGINLLDHAKVKREIEKKGMRWIVDKTVISDHIRHDIVASINHAYKMGLLTRGKLSRLKMFKLFLLSPLRAMHITFKKKSPGIIVVYPLIRLAILKAELERCGI